MVTVSADVTEHMEHWIDSQVGTGLYKSKGEVIREAIRELMTEQENERRGFQAWFVEKEDSAAKKQIQYLEKKGLI
ncbi:MAG: type II toxin-antitoxin system ParD family antitoxin [DPANN group archaeon]|nr:type II toxin-antitoxin system ParD family antitoxin [DPANN group archaeon]